jgi:hypothetical protein
MPLRLRHHDLTRRHLPSGEIALTYTGSDVREWTGRIEGYPVGFLAVVSRDEVALPPQLRVCAEDAGIALEDHPIVPRLRAAVADALYANHCTNAPALLESLTGLEVVWAPGAQRSAEDRERRAFDVVKRAIAEAARDLAARGRRRRMREVMHQSVRVETSSPDAATLLEHMQRPTARVPVPERPEYPTRAPVFDEDVLARIAADIQGARAEEMPQRLPNGVRRALLRMRAGVYVVEDGLLTPFSELKRALDQAARIDSRSTSRSVVDWDGEWPVLVRGYGERGLPGYRLDEALVRWRRRSGGASARA